MAIAAQDPSVFARRGSPGRRKLVRVDSALRLNELKQQSALLVGDVLRTAGVRHWRIPAQNDSCTQFAVLTRDRKHVLASLTSSVAMGHWCLQELSERGTAHKDVFTLAGYSNVKPLGIRVFEEVSASPQGHFTSDAAQGVEIHFWSPVEGSGLIKSGVWNPFMDVLPDPATDSAGFGACVDRMQCGSSETVTFPIDVVYTWVDGTDSRWQESKGRAMNASDPELLARGAVDAARFADNDELRFSLRSLEQYAPWIRRIWIVTSGQVPQWLDTAHPRVTVVPHREIWPDEQGLPTFNSHAIEANLHHLDGLSEHFLYFNDDFFLVRPVTPEHFFLANGVSKFFYSRALVDLLDVHDEDSISAVASKNARRLMQDSGTFTRKFFHVPSALRRSVMYEAEAEYPEVFTATRSAPFRTSMDIAAAGSFYFQYAFWKGKAVPGSIAYAYVDPGSADGRKTLRSVVRRHHVDTMVINDGSTDQTPEERRETSQILRKALHEFLPVPSLFEGSSP